MSTINQLLESANPWQSMQNEAVQTANKWEKSGLLEGLKSYDKSNMAMLLENQAKQIIVESNSTAGNTAGVSFTAGNTNYQWAGVALPLVRKVFGQIAAKEFVSVQPMSMPSGLIFYLDFQYGTTKSPFTAGDSMYGNVEDAAYPFGNKAEGGYYGEGRFGFSKNLFKVAGEDITGSAAAFATLGNNTTGYAAINFDDTYTASLVAGELYTIAVTHANVASFVYANNFADADLSTVTAWNFDLAAHTVLPQFTTTNGTVTTFVVKGAAADAPIAADFVGKTLYFHKKGNFYKEGDFEDANPFALETDYSANTNIAIPEINVKLKSDSISAETRKLKAQWTPEFAQDLNAYQNLDAEAELTSILSENISLEIDLEILSMLIQGAATTERWSARVGFQYENAAAQFVDNTSGVYYNQMSWFQTLGIKLQKVSNIIHQRTLRGGANFMVVSPAVSTILESIPGFAADNTDAETAKYAFGVQKIGAINGRYKVYKNPYMTTNVIFMGYRGNQFLETGAVYAPYVPLIMTPLIYDPETFTPRKGIMTRYAKKLIRPEFYGKIIVNHLDVV